MKQKLLILIFSIFFLPLAVQAKDIKVQKGRIRLSGLIIDVNGAGLPGVSVTVVGTDLSTTTDKRGLFIFTKVPQGQVTVQMAKKGFRTALRDAEVDYESLMPESFTVELVPEGTTSTKDGLSGKGTVYVAYSEPPKGSGPPSSDKLEIYDLLKILPYVDPLEYTTQNDDPTRPQNPLSIDPNQVMLYPPTAPQRSTYLKGNRPFYHLTFDADGQHLFTSGFWHEILVFDETNKHEKVGRIPIPAQSGVTSLNRSDDGKWILASLMSISPSILVIDGQTRQVAAMLPLDDLDGQYPLHVTSGADGQLLVAVAKPGEKGHLLIVDAYTGMTIATIEVGNMPTCVAATPDKRWAYVVNSQSGNVTVVDLVNQKAVGLLAVGVAPQQAAVTPDGKRLLITNGGSDTVSVVETSKHRLAGFVRVGKGPVGIAVTPDGKTCYVSNRVGGNISTINLDSLEEVYQTTPLPKSRPLDLELRP